MPKSVEVDDCEGDRCEFFRSKDYQMSADFVAPKDSNDLELSVKAILLGVPVPWEDKPTEICNNQVPCPLKSGQSYTYKAAFKDLSKNPRVKGTVVYELKDKNGDTMFCFQLKFKLK